MGKLSPKFAGRRCCGEESQRKCALGHGGAKEITKSCCMCEPMETAQSLGDDTHAVVIRLTWAREHGLHRGVVPSVGGL